MGILLPIVIPLAVALGGTVDPAAGTSYVILLGSTASFLAGAIFGDHCSPISDTTIISSMAAATAFGQVDTPEAALNRGNALILLGRYQAAIDARGV